MAGREVINQEIERIFQRVRDGRADLLSTFSEKILAKMDPKLAEALRVHINAVKARAGKVPDVAHHFRVGIAHPIHFVGWCADGKNLAHEDRIFKQLCLTLATDRFTKSLPYAYMPIPTGIKNILAGKVVECKPYEITTHQQQGEIMALLDREEVLLGRKYSPHYLSIDIAPPSSPTRDCVLVKVYRPYTTASITQKQ